MRRISALTVFATLAMAAMPAAWAQPAFRDVLPAGSVLQVRLDNTLSSRNAYRGEKFSTTVDSSADGSRLPNGTKVIGVVTGARRSTRRQPAVMDVAFRTVRLPNGATYPISGSLASLDNRSVQRSRSGRLMSRRSSNNNLKFVAYGAGAGFVLSALTHGNALTGALLGAAGGYLAGMLNKHKLQNRELTLRPDTQFGVRLNRQVALTESVPARYGAASRYSTASRYQDVLPAGSVLRVRLNQDLSSRTAQVGDDFTASVEPQQDGSGLPSGATVVGTVTSLQRATRSRPAVMDVAFQTLRLPGGATYPIDGSLASLDNKSVQRTNSGRLMSRRSSNNNLKFLGYGAGAGFVISALTHGNALTGALLGAAGGYLAGMLNKKKLQNQEVSLHQGTQFGVRLNQRLALANTSTRRTFLR